MATIARRIGSTSRPPHSGRRLGAGWVAVLLAMLVVFSWQSFVAQTHNHFASAPISTAAGQTGAVAATSSDRNSPFDSPANCPICREIAQSAAYLPPAAELGPVPAVYWLSGLTCTEENFSVKSGAQRYAAELGVALIIPDTSPRGVNIPGEDAQIDIGTGAGFYVNATAAAQGAPTEEMWAGRNRL